MIVTTCEFSTEFLRKNIKQPEIILDKIQKTILPEYKHIECLLNNTRFYVATLIARDEKIQYEDKRAACDVLLSNIRVVGYIGIYISMQELSMRYPKEKLLKYYRGDKYGSDK